ncbi:MAG TPA: ZIP family metal transporter [Gammaproteobacteria bacterium]|nr:ZIP family metal transporter [Gammaproteobacteria bacterium]
MSGNWAWVLALCGSAAIASAFGAVALAGLGERRLARMLPALVSFSTGVMLGAACLDLLPAVFAGAAAGRAANLGLALAGGILVFFALEKLIHWHHSHDIGPGSAAQAENRATTVMVLTGTSLHNFLAGVLLAAAVLTDLKAALVLFAAILAHHIPQQLGDFSVLLMTGYRRARALALTVASSAALFAGGVIAFVLLRHGRAALPFVVAVAAASLIYIALADLIPRLRGGHGGRQALAVIALVAAGIGVIYAVIRLLPG